MILRIVPDVTVGAPAVMLPRSASASDAARQMHSHDVGAVLIVESGELVGIFTERDVSFRVIATGSDPDKTTLGEVMTPGPQTVSADDTALSALERMAEHHFRHLPVADGDDLVGVVAMRDVLASAASQLSRELERMSVDLPPECRIATDIMRNTALVTLPPEATVKRAAELMMAKDIGAVLIIDSGELVGIFTERDVSFRVVSENLDPERTPLGDVMSTNPVVVRPGDSCNEVVVKMQAGRFRHLPIMDGGKPVGILSIRDLFSYMRHRLESHFKHAMIKRTRDMIRNYG
jgi:CBS domain-containing protein